jgi:putative hydrolase of the HAD superfamily
LWFDGRLFVTSRISKELFKVEIDNLKLYGYGIKGYILSMIEAAMTISRTIPFRLKLSKNYPIRKELLEKPIVLLEGVEETLEALYGKYKLVVATKGDLLDQRRKLHNWFGSLFSPYRSDVRQTRS